MFDHFSKYPTIVELKVCEQQLLSPYNHETVNLGANASLKSSINFQSHLKTSLLVIILARLGPTWVNYHQHGFVGFFDVRRSSAQVSPSSTTLIVTFTHVWMLACQKTPNNQVNAQVSGIAFVLGVLQKSVPRFAHDFERELKIVSSVRAR